VRCSRLSVRTRLDAHQVDTWEGLVSVFDELFEAFRQAAAEMFTELFTELFPSPGQRAYNSSQTRSGSG
jgi:hypothetical protein